MARNTGTGTRAAANTTHGTTGRFVNAKRDGGAFHGVNRTSFWRSLRRWLASR